MISVTAAAKVKPDKIQAYMDTAAELVSETRKEEGNISYELYQDSKDPQIMVFLERWKSKDALALHNQTKHFTEIVPKLVALIDGDMEVTLYNLIK